MNKSLYRASTAVLALTAITNSLGGMNASAAETPAVEQTQATDANTTTPVTTEQVQTETPAVEAPVEETTEEATTPAKEQPVVETPAKEAPQAEVKTQETTPAAQALAVETETPVEAPAKENSTPATTEKVQTNVQKAVVKTQAVAQTKAVAEKVPAAGNVKQDIQDKVKTNPDENLLGTAQSFHIFANEANLETHTNGNVAIGKLTGANANFGTNIKDEAEYQNKIGDISYIQSVANGVKLMSSSGVAERDTLLVVGKDFTVATTDNGNAYTLDGTKLDVIKNIEQDSADTTYINFDKEFSQLRATSEKLSNGATKTAVVEKSGSNYTLDISKYEKENGQIILNLDAADLIDSSGTFTLTNIPKDASVIINVKADNAAQKLEVQKQIFLEYADGEKRSNKETENFTDSTVLWNFEQFAGLIELKNTWQGTILATDASLHGTSNIDGSIIVNKFLGAGETHRWDFQGKKVTEDEPGSDSDSESTSEDSESDSASESTSEDSESDSASESTSEDSESDSASESTSEDSESDSASESTSEDSESTSGTTTSTGDEDTTPDNETTSDSDSKNATTTGTQNATVTAQQGTEQGNGTGLPQTGEGTAAAAGLGLGALFAGAMALIAGRRKKN